MVEGIYFEKKKGMQENKNFVWLNIKGSFLPAVCYFFLNNLFSVSARLTEIGRET